MVATSDETPLQGPTGRVKGLIPVGVGLGAIVVAFVVGFLPSIRWMAGEWSASSGVMSHGYLIAAISAVLFCRAIPEAAASRLKPAWWALIPLAGMSLVWLVGYVATIVAVQTVVLPAMLLTAIAAAFGLGAARRLAFPVLFFYFALPALEHLQFIFQAITVFAASVLVHLADIPALVEGNFVQIPQGVFEIAGGCSGLSFIVAGVSLAVLYGHLYYDRLSHSLRLVVLTTAVAMIGNWIRVFGIIVVGYRTEMQSPLVEDHLTLGWIMFAIFMVPVFFYAQKLEESSDNGIAGTKAPAGERALPANWLAVVSSIALMLLGPTWAATVSTSNVSPDALEINMPSGNGIWQGPQHSRWEWQPRFTGADAERVVQYGNREHVVLVYANLYLSQEQDKELIYLHNDLTGGWMAGTGAEHLSVATDSGPQVFRQINARNYIGDWLIWYRYQVGDQFETSNAAAKLAQALEALRGRPEAGVVAFATPCRGSCENASASLADFVVRIGHSITVNSSEDLQ